MASNNTLNNTVPNNFSVTTATAGVTRTFTVTNTDNSNTASAALVAVTTGGASAGDAYHTVSTTTTTWAFGVDNSVTSPTADPFVISQNSTLGTNNVMSIAKSGAINCPLQPAFLAYLNAEQANVTGDATNYQVPFNTEIFDQGNNFASNTFTAPVTGRYLFNASVNASDFTGGATSGFITLVTTAYTFIYFVRPVATFNAPSIINVTTSMIAGETAIVRILYSGGTKTVDVYGEAPGNIYTYFSGYLVA